MTEHQKSMTRPTPDWHFGTNEDLRSHAYELMGCFIADLVDMDNLTERPAGTMAESGISIPCPNPDNLNRPAQYLGHCSDACEDLGLVIRQAVLTDDERTGGSVLYLRVSTVDALTRASMENDAVDADDTHFDRAFRTH